MPRKPEIDRPIALELKLPESVRGWLDLYLFSELEGRVPKGKYQEFFLDRIRDFRESKRLDLAPFGFEPGYYVFGPKSMIDALEEKLRNAR